MASHVANNEELYCACALILNEGWKMRAAHTLCCVVIGILARLFAGICITCAHTYTHRFALPSHSHRVSHAD